MKKQKILAADTKLHVQLKHRHPRQKMRLGGVEISIPGNYVIPAGTDLGTAEVLHWFEIKQPAAEAKPEAKKEA